MVTVEILDNGEIVEPVIDFLETETSSGQTPDSIHISDNVYGAVYNGPDGDGWLATITIADNGEFGTSIENYEYDTSDGDYPHIRHYQDNIFIISYEDAGNDGTLVSVEILENGDIGTVIDSVVFDSGNGNEPDTQIFDNIIAITYTGVDSDGWVKTVAIQDNGDLGAVIDSFEFDADAGLNPDDIQISTNPNIYAIAYKGTDSDGFLVTLEIMDNGSIVDTPVDNLEFDIANCEYPLIVNVNGDVYAIVYTGVDGDGWVKTMTIQAGREWSQIDNWIATVNATGWQVIESWTATLDGEFYPLLENITASEDLVDRKQDQAGSGATTSTTIYLTASDNDNRDSLTACHIWIREYQDTVDAEEVEVTNYDNIH